MKYAGMPFGMWALFAGSFTAMAVEVDITGCFLILIKRIKKVPANTPVTG